jgi:hypothetical protein
MRRWMKLSLICITVIVFLMLLSMLIVPWQVKKQGTNWIAQNTSRTLHIDKVRFNPFSLTLELSNVDLSEQNSSEVFVGFSRLLFSASSKSLIEWALILDHIELDDPYVNIEKLAQEEFNFSDFTRLGGDSSEKEPQEEEKPPSSFHFSFNNIVLKNGSVDFSDESSVRPSHHEIRQFDMSIPVIGNVPYMTDIFVEPALFMRLNGAEIKAVGQLKPFHESLATHLDMSFHGVDLAFYAAQSPIELPVLVDQGDLDFSLGLIYQIADDKKPQLLLNGQFAVSNLIVDEPDGSQLLLLPSLIVDLEQADVFNTQAHFRSIDLYQPELFIDRALDGILNIQRLFAAEQTPNPTAEQDDEETQETPASKQLPVINIDNFTLHQGKIHYQDDAVIGQFQNDVLPIDVKLEQFSTSPGELTDVTFNFSESHGLQFNLEGQFGLNPLTAELDINSTGLELAAYSSYLSTLLNYPLEGRIDMASHISYLTDGTLLTKQLKIDLHDLLIPFGDKDQFTLTALKLNDGSVDLKQQEINIDSIALTGGDLNISLLQDGSLSPLRLLKQQASAEAPEEKSQAESVAENTADSAPWTMRLENFDLSQFNLNFTDNSDPRQPQIKVTNLNITASTLTWPEAEKSPVHIAATVGNKGDIEIDGSLIHTPLQLSTNTTIKGLSLADFNDFIPQGLNLRLDGGTLYTTLKTDVEQGKDGFNGNFSGDTSIHNFNLADPIGAGELLTWKTLDFKNLQGEIAPFALHIDEVALSEYTANIAISQDGRVNLTSITADEVNTSEEEKETVIAEEEPETTETDQQKDVADISIDALTLQGGTVSFIDRHMPSTFSTTMYQLGGRVSGLASAAEMQADVDLRGQLENHSPLTINGKINPLSKDLFADLTFSFKDIDLTPLTPYSGTYLGYVIDKGKLNLDLNYHIEHQKIDAGNKVMIDQFTFGDSVESDQATSLPVSLAIALLKDSSGKINLDIPISGDLNDPSFSIAGTVWTIVRNLLVKAATSPFALLSALAGGDEDFSSILFTNGLAELTSEQMDKVQKLADILSERPGLTLEISGFADAENDPEAYRVAQLNSQLQHIKYAELVDDGTAPESSQQITISAEEYPDLLWDLYKKADFPRPRNALGMLQKLPQEELEKLLLANIIVGDEQLAALAHARALVVRTTLEKTNPELKSRLFLKNEDIFKQAKEGSSSRVEFSIQAK